MILELDFILSASHVDDNRHVSRLIFISCCALVNGACSVGNGLCVRGLAGDKLWGCSGAASDLRLVPALAGLHASCVNPRLSPRPTAALSVEIWAQLEYCHCSCQ